MTVEYPTILRRYLSSFIDIWFVIGVLFFVPYVIGDGDSTLSVRITAAIIMLFLYEPLFTSRSCTLGQKITGIRIRKFGDYQKLSFPAAVLRVLIKGFLGFISLFLIIFSKDKRAIHDFASDSIVILEPADEPDYSAQPHRF